jgi:hypothetical protein
MRIHTYFDPGDGFRSPDDGAAQPDQQESQEDYVHDGRQIALVIEPDTDLGGGKVETRQSASGIVACLDGEIARWLAKAERMVFNGTTKKS